MVAPSYVNEPGVAQILGKSRAWLKANRARLERGTPRSTISITARDFNGTLRQATAATIITLACLATPATASLQPPARFDHPFAGPVVVERLPTSNVRRECEALFGGPMPAVTKACGVAINGTCRVILAVYAKVSSRQMLIRHEIAHCNGWSADHER